MPGYHLPPSRCTCPAPDGGACPECVKWQKKHLRPGRVTRPMPAEAYATAEAARAAYVVAARRVHALRGRVQRLTQRGVAVPQALRHDLEAALAQRERVRVEGEAQRKTREEGARKNSRVSAL